MPADGFAQKISHPIDRSIVLALGSSSSIPATHLPGVNEVIPQKRIMPDQPVSEVSTSAPSIGGSMEDVLFIVN